MPNAVIVAHGFPSDPAPAQAWMQALAVRVAMHCPGWGLRGATLAAPGALEQALSVLRDPVVYPFFMAKGWFTGRELPRRLGLAGYPGLRVLDPFGTDPALPDLVARIALEGCASAGLDPAATTLFLAAHGSKVSRTSADSTHAMAEILTRRALFAALRVGFVEESPFLAEAAQGLDPAICLPFFNLRAGHVAGDVPDALEKAGFRGPLLPAVGEDARVAPLIARALQAAI